MQWLATEERVIKRCGSSNEDEKWLRYDKNKIEKKKCQRNLPREFIRKKVGLQLESKKKSANENFPSKIDKHFF